MLGTLLILVSTGLVQGKSNIVTPASPQPKPLDEGIIPCLEVQLVYETLTFTPADDTYIANLDPSEINGALDYLATRNRYGAGDVWECDILVNFDLTSIPSFTPIVSAALSMYYYRWGDSNPAGRPLTAYKITSDWDEMTVNFATQPSKADAVSASENIPYQPGTWMTWTLTTDVQAAVDNPGTCFGWEIMDETYWGGYNVPATYFYPKEGVPPSEPFTPYLQVETPDGTLTFPPTDDTYIANLDPSEINGALNYIATRNRYGAGDVWECDILIRFDLSTIPPSTPVTSATLNLYYSRWGDSDPAGRPLTAYRITSDWREMTVNYNTRPSKAGTQSTWANIPMSPQIGMSWNLTADAQQYVNTPDTNYGWEIRDETYWGGYNVPAAYFIPKQNNTPGDAASLIYGRITNKKIDGNAISFEAVRTKVISFSPFAITIYDSHETITIARAHIGLIGGHFILASCRLRHT